MGKHSSLGASGFMEFDFATIKVCPAESLEF